jgi:hypothetical protein
MVAPGVPGRPFGAPPAPPAPPGLPAPPLPPFPPDHRGNYWKRTLGLELSDVSTQPIFQFWKRKWDM